MSTPFRIADEYQSEISLRRRLADKILADFESACEEGKFGLAWHLLDMMKAMIEHSPMLAAGADRRRPKSLAAIREGLWSLQYPSPWSTNAAGLD